MVGSMAEKSVWIFITLFPVFVSITQFSDFWVMSYGNWKHILGVFNFHNLVFNGILVIKPTYMGLTVSALSSPALLYVPTNNFFLHTKNPTHKNSSPFPNPSIPLHTSSPLSNHVDRAPTSSNSRRPQEDQWTWWRSSGLGFFYFILFYFFH